MDGERIPRAQCRDKESADALSRINGERRRAADERGEHFVDIMKRRLEPR